MPSPATGVAKGLQRADVSQRRRGLKPRCSKRLKLFFSEWLQEEARQILYYLKQVFTSILTQWCPWHVLKWHVIYIQTHYIYINVLPWNTSITAFLDNLYLFFHQHSFSSVLMPPENQKRFDNPVRCWGIKPTLVSGAKFGACTSAFKCSRFWSEHRHHIGKKSLGVYAQVIPVSQKAGLQTAPDS